MHEDSKPQAKNSNWAQTLGPLILMSHYLFRVFPRSCLGVKTRLQRGWFTRFLLPWYDINIKLRTCEIPSAWAEGRAHSGLPFNCNDARLISMVMAKIKVQVPSTSKFCINIQPHLSTDTKTLLEMDERCLLCLPGGSCIPENCGTLSFSMNLGQRLCSFLVPG